MTVKLAAISPRTNAFMTAGPPDSPEQGVFDQMFSTLAYTMLESKMPRLLDSIVTFKVLDSSLDESRATGVFIVALGQKFIYVPVVLAGDKVDPPEVMYDKDADAFLPLDKAWLEEIEKDTDTPLGGPAEAPDSANAGVDLRGITTPPSSGRFSYASAQMNLCDFLEEAPNTVKVAFANLLKESPRCLRAAVEYHGAERLTKSLRPHAEKVASAPAQQVWVLTQDSPATDFRAAFGKGAAVAYQTACSEGVVVRDMRKTASIPVNMDDPVAYEEVTEGGVYKIIDSEGKIHVAAVFINPECMDDLVDAERARPIKIRSPYGSRWRDRGDRFLVLFPNGDYALTGGLVALTTVEDMPVGVVATALNKDTVATLRNGKQALISVSQGMWQATKPFRARGVTKNDNGESRAEIVDWWESEDGWGSDLNSERRNKLPARGSVVLSEKLKVKKLHAPPGGNTVFVPAHFKSVALRNRINAVTLVQDVSTLVDLISAGLVKQASHQVRVKNSGQGDWSIEGQRVGNIVSAINKLAADGVHAQAALNFLREISPGYSKTAHVVPAARLANLPGLFKQANPMMMGGGGGMPPMDPSMMGGGGGMPPMDPSMMGGDPSMMGGDPSMMGGDPSMMGGAPGGQMQAPPINPEFMEAAADLRDAGVFDTAAVASLVQSAEMTELVAQYLPHLEKSLDSLGRIILSVAMKQGDLMEELGEEDFSTLQAKLKQVFRGLGDLIIRLDRHTLAAEAPSVEGLGSATWTTSGQ